MRVAITQNNTDMSIYGEAEYTTSLLACLAKCTFDQACLFNSLNNC